MREYSKKYCKTDTFKAIQKRYRATEAGKESKNRYKKTDKGKASYRKFYDTYGYVHQNKNGLRRKVFELYHECQICGSTGSLSMDHMHPKSKGGTDDLSNLWTLCSSCNSFKRDRLFTPGMAVLVGDY